MSTLQRLRQESVIAVDIARRPAIPWRRVTRPQIKRILSGRLGELRLPPNIKFSCRFSRSRDCIIFDRDLMAIWEYALWREANGAQPHPS